MPSKKRATPVSLQPLDALFGTNEESINGISEIAIGSLHPFPNHPFQVRDDKKMEELSEDGILTGMVEMITVILCWKIAKSVNILMQDLQRQVYQES